MNRLTVVGLKVLLHLTTSPSVVQILPTCWRSFWLISPAKVDLAIMALCNASIIGNHKLISRVKGDLANPPSHTFSAHADKPTRLIPDYGTFGVWGALLAGGETIVSNKTFRCQDQLALGDQSRSTFGFNLNQNIQITNKCKDIPFSVFWDFFCSLCH